MAIMEYQLFKVSLEYGSCPDGLAPGLRALWYDAQGAWDTAHEIVQARDDVMAARIHAYLHRKEGDEANARYWHRRTGTCFHESGGGVGRAHARAHGLKAIPAWHRSA